MQQLPSDPGEMAEQARTAGETELAALLDAALWRLEQERRQLTSLLHDQILQALLALRWQLDDLSGTALARATLTAAVADTWRVLAELQPIASETPSGAAAGVAQNCQLLLFELTRGWPGAVRFDAVGSFGDGGDLQVLTLRCLREAVQNTLRHGHAGQIAVRMRGGARYCWLHVLDDGVGARANDVADAMRSGRYGLRSLLWAAHQRGGKLRYCTGPDGFGLHLQIPQSPGEDKQ